MIRRKIIPIEIKNKLLKEQNNLCNICSKELQYYYDVTSNNLPSAIIGNQTITISDPFGYSNDAAIGADVELFKGYMFVTNEAGVSIYDEAGSA